MSCRALFAPREETWRCLNDCRRWNFIVHVQWSGRGGVPIKQTVWEYFISMVSGGFKHKIKINRCWCRTSVLSQGKFLLFILPYSSIPGNFGFFSTLWLTRGDKKCPCNFTYYQMLRKLLGEKEMYFCIISSWKGKLMSSVIFWASTPTTRTCAAKHCRSNAGRCLSVQKRWDFRHSSGFPLGRIALMGL